MILPLPQVKRPLYFIFAVSIFLAAAFSPHAHAQQLRPDQQQRLNEYKAAATSGDIQQVEQAWQALSGDPEIMEHIRTREPHLEIHYLTRHYRAGDNALQRDAAQRGEIVPPEEIQRRLGAHEQPERTGPVPVRGDPDLANLADPSKQHVPMEWDPYSKMYVERTKANEARRAREAAARQAAQRAATGLVDGPPPPDPDATGGPRPAPAERPFEEIFEPGETGEIFEPGERPPESSQQISDAPESVDEPPEVEDTKKKKSPAPPVETPTSELADGTQKRSGGDAEVTGGKSDTSSTKSSSDQHDFSKRPLTDDEKRLMKVGMDDAGKILGDAKQKFGQAIDGLQTAGDVAAGIQKEREKAALEGREFSATGAAGEFAADQLGRQQYELSKRISEEEIKKAEAKGEGKGWAFLNSAWRNIKERLAGTYKMSQDIHKEEAAREVELAQKEGRAASGFNAKWNAGVRTAGALAGFAAIGESYYYDADADRQAAETGRNLEAKAKETLEKGFLEAGELEKRIDDLVKNWDTNDPAIQKELEELRARHAKLNEDLAAHAARLKAKGVLNENDPELIALQGALESIPEEPGAEAELEMAKRAQIEKLIGVCNFEGAQAFIRVLPEGDVRSGLQANLQNAVAHEDITKTHYESAKAAAESKDYQGALAHLQNAAAHTRCDDSRQKIETVRQKVQLKIDGIKKQDAAYQEVASLDCSHMGNAHAIWDKVMGEATCVCNEGFERNNAGTACRVSQAVQMQQVSCSHIAGARVDWHSFQEKPVCVCKNPNAFVNSSGTACVEQEVLYPQRGYENPPDELPYEPYPYDEPPYQPDDYEQRMREQMGLDRQAQQAMEGLVRAGQNIGGGGYQGYWSPTHGGSSYSGGVNMGDRVPGSQYTYGDMVAAGQGRPSPSAQGGVIPGYGGGWQGGWQGSHRPPPTSSYQSGGQSSGTSSGQYQPQSMGGIYGLDG